MSYTKPIERPTPIGKLCDYGCGRPARYYFKRPKKWCCEDWAGRCPGEKKKRQENREIRKTKIDLIIKEHPIFDLEHVHVLYPNVYQVDYLDSGVLRFNNELKIVQGKCTYYDCMKWYNITRVDLNLREWALRSDNQCDSMDGYKFYCSIECRKLCPAFGKSGALMEKEMKMIQTINWEEEEWWGGNASISQRNLWREVCLVRDKFQCQRCGSPAEHVHHIWPVKTHPESELDPVCGISVCKECHYTHFHKKGTMCSMNNLAKKLCFPIKFGVPVKSKREEIPPPLLVF